MSKEITTELNQELADLILRYDIEVNSRKSIILEILKNNDIEVSEERFNRYQAEYNNRLATFEMLKSELEQQIVLPLTNGQPCHWELNYNSNILHIYLEDEQTDE